MNKSLISSMHMLLIFYDFSFHQDAKQLLLKFLKQKILFVDANFDFSLFFPDNHLDGTEHILLLIHEKTRVLPMRKQRCRSAVQ